jgi:hypothetical protein
VYEANLLIKSPYYIFVGSAIRETERLINVDLLSNFEHSSSDFNCIFFIMLKLMLEDGVKEISLPQLVS